MPQVALATRPIAPTDSTDPSSSSRTYVQIPGRPNLGVGVVEQVLVGKPPVYLVRWQNGTHGHYLRTQVRPSLPPPPPRQPGDRARVAAFLGAMAGIAVGTGSVRSDPVESVLAARR
jgi:hypothetical protein